MDELNLPDNLTDLYKFDTKINEYPHIKKILEKYFFPWANKDGSHHRQIDENGIKKFYKVQNPKMVKYYKLVDEMEKKYCGYLLEYYIEPQLYNLQETKIILEQARESKYKSKIEDISIVQEPAIINENINPNINSNISYVINLKDNGNFNSYVIGNNSKIDANISNNVTYKNSYIRNLHNKDHVHTSVKNNDQKKYLSIHERITSLSKTVKSSNIKRLTIDDSDKVLLYDSDGILIYDHNEKSTDTPNKESIDTLNEKLIDDHNEKSIDTLI